MPFSIEIFDSLYESTSDFALSIINLEYILSIQLPSNLIWMYVVGNRSVCPKLHDSMVSVLIGKRPFVLGQVIEGLRTNLSEQDTH